jgi:hypothetical protein
MRVHRGRFVLLCQQALALAAVLAVVVPATRVGTLDIVGPAHRGAHPGAHPGVHGSQPAPASRPAGSAARR